MLNEIISGIANKLNATFGDDYEIYQDDVEQGFQEPCFFISVLKPELAPLSKWRSMKRNPFDVLYFPADPGKNAELFTVAEQLMGCLQWITLSDGGLLHGTSMNYEVLDDVLHFMVNFNFPLITTREETCMETLETDVGTTKGD